MPTMQQGARTKMVETRTTEEVPVGEGGGLGCLPLEYLANCSEEELAIANVRIYRYDAGTPGVFLKKLDPALRIDEDWIGAMFGGGTYGVKVYSKGGKSGFDRAVRIDPRLYGPAKTEPLPTSANAPAAAPAQAAPANDAVMNRLIDAMERQSDRIERLFEQRNTPQPPSQSDVAQNSVVSVMAEASKAAIGVVAEAAKAAISAPAAPAQPANSFDQDLQRLKILKEIAAPAASTHQPDMMGQVTQFVTLFEALDKFRGGGGNGDWKTVVADKLIDHIPEVVDLGKTIMTGRSKEAEEQRKREEARARFSDNVRALQGQPPRPGAAPAAPSPAAGPAPAAPGETFSPLRVVPIDGQPAPAASAEPAQPEITPPAEGAETPQEAAGMLQEWFKRRVAQLVAEGDEPAAVLDFIDRVDPVVGAIITKSSEKQIRAFLAADPILAEITRLPNYEAFLAGLLDELRGDDDEGEAPSGSPPALKVN